MQLFIDNWSATLLAPATASAVSLSVEPAKAALLTGLGSGDFYRLTLVEVDASGAEIDWDVVQVTAVAGGVLTVTRTSTARSWAYGALIEARLTAAGMGELRDAGGGTSVGSAPPQALGAVAAGTSPQASRQDHVHPAPSPGDIGAATAAQGAKADTAVQPAALTAALADKVDKVAGKGLSSNDYTTAEKNKLAGLEGSHFKGLHGSLAALQAAHPSAVAGDYADVDAGAGVDVVRYLWDVSDTEWVAQAASGGSMTPAQVKAAYESNPDTNAFTDAEQAKLGGIAPGATANSDTDSLAEGPTNKYFTEGRVRSTVLTGLSLLTGGVISAADSVLSALGKLQKQISDAITAIGGKQDTLVSGTNLKTVNGNSLLGAGDLAISGSGMANPMTAAGDLIVGGSGGAPTRLPLASTDGYVLTRVAGAVAWAAAGGGSFTGGTLTSALNEAPIVTLASAATTDIGAAAANTLSISGTTTITALGTIASGAERSLVFQGALTLTHNATSLILPTGANITTAAGDVAEFVSLGAGNWRCVGYLRASGAALSGGGGGGLTNLTEAKTVAAPNVSVPVVSLSVTITEGSGDFAIVAKGAGATLAQVPDGNTTGGAKRGAYATDFQKGRVSATQVASGNYSAILGGYAGTASGLYSAVLYGNASVASSNYTLAGGDGSVASGAGAIALGTRCTAGGQYSVAIGYRATTRGVHGAWARSAGGFFASGDGAAQSEWFPLTYQTTSATPAVVTTDQYVGNNASAGNQVTLPNSSAYRFDGRVVARSSAGDAATWDIKGLVKRGSGAGSVALVGTPTVTQVFADVDATSWAVSIGVNTTIGCLTVTVTGAASTTIRWNAAIDTTEVSFA